jgi:hypothetical protein
MVLLYLELCEYHMIWSKTHGWMIYNDELEATLGHCPNKCTHLRWFPLWIGPPPILFKMRTQSQCNRLHHNTHIIDFCWFDSDVDIINPNWCRWIQVGWTNHKPTKGIIGPFLRWWDWWGRTQRARQFSLWSRSQGPMLHCAREIILTRLILMRRPSLLLIQHENTNSTWSLIMDNYRKIIKEYMHPIGSYMWLALISWYFTRI